MIETLEPHVDIGVLTLAFAVWAAVVALLGSAVVYELIQLRNGVTGMSKALNAHILHSERRQTHTETFLSIKHEDFVPIGSSSD